MKKFSYILIIIAIFAAAFFIISQPSAEQLPEESTETELESSEMVDVHDDIDVGADADENLDADSDIVENPEETADEEESIVE